MKFIELEQGSEEWLSWRKTVITATDASCIMGNNPWITAYKCWQRKLDLIPKQESNDAMERGKRLEPIIRERFIKKFGLNMTPKVVESSEYEFLGASLDGLSDCGKYILEIKTGGHNLYKMAQEGVVPRYYLDQIQHQLLVTKANKCFYQIGSEDENMDIVLEIFPEPEFPKKFIPVAREFLKCIAFNEPPPLQKADYTNKDDDVELLEDLKAIQQIEISIKELEEKKNSKRKKVIERCQDQSCICNGIKIMKTTVRGRVDYEMIPEIKNVDLDKYRKSSTSVWKIMVA